MELGLFDYHLPPELIAQEPAEPRDASRLLVLDRQNGSWRDDSFRSLPALLRPGDCLVANESRVIPARLLGVLEPAGRPVEVLMLRPVLPPPGQAKEPIPSSGERWEALVRPGRRCRAGACVSVAAGMARVRVVAERGEGIREVAVEAPSPVAELLERFGLPPLPPYIDRHDA